MKSPEEKLQAAVLAQAMGDVLRALRCPHSPAARQDADDAISWSERGAELGWHGPFAFDDLCSSLEVSADRVRRWFRERREELPATRRERCA